jgi:hypothetical protein
MPAVWERLKQYKKLMSADIFIHVIAYTAAVGIKFIYNVFKE